MTPISMQLTDKDLIEAGRAFYLANLRRMLLPETIWGRILGWGATILLVTAVVAKMIDTGADPFSTFAYLALGATVIAAICALTYFVTIPAKAKRNLAQQASLKGDITVAWNETHAFWRGAAFSQDVALADYVAYAEKDGMLLLYQNSWAYNVIPRRAFQDDGQRLELVEKLERAGVPRADRGIRGAGARRA